MRQVECGTSWQAGVTVAYPGFFRLKADWSTIVDVI